MSGATSRSIATVLMEARTLLSDLDNSNPAYRYSDDQLLEAFNGAMIEARSKRPDLFLDPSLGLRNPVPYYTTDNTASPFPLDLSVYNAFVYYVVGRTSLRDDTYADNSRATELMNKFVSQLTSVVS